MSKKRYVSAAVCAVLVCLCAAVFFSVGRSPFKSLKASDIISAQVLITPPDETVQIADMNELVSHLNEIVVYSEDNSYTEYEGQAAVFTLCLSDGTGIEIVEYNPFVIINGTGYRAKYGPCEELSRYANSLTD